MLKFIILFFIVSCCGLNLRAAPVDEETELFRNDYSLLTDVKLYVKEHLTARTFSDAVMHCQAEGASLFVPKSYAQLDALLKFRKKSPTWLGIHNKFSIGTFVTLDGEYLDEMYKNWRAGEPNNYGGIEHCAVMDPTGTYNDISCDTSHGYVCAKNATNVQINDICETSDIEYNYHPLTDHCYKLHKIPRNWRDAFEICKAENSKLAIINDDNEAKFLMEIYGKYPIENIRGDVEKSKVYLGFSDILISGLFLTSDGKFLKDTGYEIWSTEQDNYTGGERCGTMTREGKLNDVACNKKALFICEKELIDPASRIHGRNTNLITMPE